MTEVQAPATIQVDPSYGDPHEVGNADCAVGWCGGQGFPAPCEEPGCGGLCHADFGDEDSDGDYWLYTKCDRCGEPHF